MKMNKKTAAKLLLAFTLTAGVMTSCEDYDDDVTNLQEQIDKLSSTIADVERTVAAGKFVVSYSSIAGGYELLLSDGSKLTITNGVNGTGANGVDGKDGVSAPIPLFRVVNGFWETSADEGATYVQVKDGEGNPVNAQGNAGTDASANVTINEQGNIVIGGVVTDLKVSNNVPNIMINEVDGLYIISLDGQEFKVLAEGSAYNGLQSVSYRKQYHDDYNDFVASYQLYDIDPSNNDAVLLAVNAPTATFKVWPKTMDLAKASFDFTDTYKTRAAEPMLEYVAGSAKWVDGKDGILSIGIKSTGIDVNNYYASSLDVTINGHTTASDYFNVRAYALESNDLFFVHTYDSVSVPCDYLVDYVNNSWASSNYPQYTFEFDKSYNLNDSVALGYNRSGSFESMEDMGFSGITVSFAQTPNKAQGIFEIKDGVVTAKAETQASAINEVCYVTATYKNAEGVTIVEKEFAVKAIRKAAPVSPLVDIVLQVRDNASLDLVYSASEQKVALNVRAFLNEIGGRDYMANNVVNNRTYPLYYTEIDADGHVYAKATGIYVSYYAGETTDKDELYLVVPAGTALPQVDALYSYNSGYSIPTSDLATATNWDWRYNTTIYAVNGATKRFTFKIEDVSCIREVEISQNTAFIVDGKTTIVGNWDEAAKAFEMRANLEDLYSVKKNTVGHIEDITYKLAPKAEQSEAVKDVYDQISVLSNNWITVTPVVDIAKLGAIKINAFITGTDIKATINNVNGSGEYCEVALAKPVQEFTVAAFDSWKIDGAANKTFNVGEKAKLTLLDKDVNVAADKKNKVVNNGAVVNDWGVTAYGATIEYSIVRYSETVNEGTFTIDSATGIITCNNVNIASNLVITVKATVKYNWGTVEKTIDVNAGLNQ
jgi:hypothetical protein